MTGDVCIGLTGDLLLFVIMHLRTDFGGNDDSGCLGVIWFMFCLFVLFLFFVFLLVGMFVSLCFFSFVFVS